MAAKGNPTAGGPGRCNNIPNQQNIIVEQAAQNAIAQLAKQILANTNVTLKTEVIKLPEHCGQTGKDTIYDLEFIFQINECQVTNK
jgi:hypothetical protein